jgi:NAD(P)-dependent dehydrogenase (short-subunit alcohol dehydrogenase family)
MGSESTLRNALLIAQKRDKTLEDGLQIFASTSPQKRLIQLEEVADLIVILASISAKGIMGQPINVDGGAVMI